MISIIICSVAANKFALVTENFKSLLGNAPYEIIGIHDAKSLSEGYNRGIDRSRGDIVIFCHDDIEVLTPSFHQQLCNYLESYDGIGCAGTDRMIESAWFGAGDPYIHGAVAYPAGNNWPSDRFDVQIWGDLKLTVVPNIQALEGFFFAVRRTVLDRVRFDEVNFDGFHVYDTDFTFAAYLSGFRLAVCKDLLIAHQSGGNFNEEYRVYRARFAEKYRDRLVPLEPNKSKIGLARNLDRSQVLRLFSRGS